MILTPVELTFTSAGLTTATNAYSTGFQLGTLITVANLVGTSGGYAYITKVVLEDDSNIIGVVDVNIFNATVTLSSDRTAFAVSDADALKRVDIITMPYPIIDGTGGNNRTSIWTGRRLVKMAATSAFIGLETRSGHTFFGATTALHGIIYVEQVS